MEVEAEVPLEVSQDELSQVEAEEEEGEETEVTDLGAMQLTEDSVAAMATEAEVKVATSTPATVKNPRLKQKQYIQRYRPEWERLDFCRGWLQAHPSNRILGFCKACNRALHARRNDLRKHANCSKHKANMEAMARGGAPPTRRGRDALSRPISESLLQDPDLVGWCVRLPGDARRVWCRQCRCSLGAQLKALKTHSRSRKHLNNGDEDPQSPPAASDSGDGAGEYQLMEMSMDGGDKSGFEAGDGERDGRATSPLLESDFAGRVTYSIGLGNRRVGFLGAGQISQAIAQGMLEQGLLLPHDVIVSAPSPRNMMQWKRWKCRTTSNNDTVVRDADIIFIAVKASVLVRLIGKLTPVADGRTRLFISLVPGVTRERMAALLSCRVLPVEPVEGEELPQPEITGPPLHVVRAAPNKMMAISAGFCAYCMGEDVPHALYLVIETMFSALGTCVQVEEHLMDAYSTMIASGAAFTCAFIEAMVQGGVSLDMGWDEALKVSSAVVLGTAKLLMRTAMDPSTLRKSISTPGGSTIAGLAALQRGGLDDAVGKALQLACDRTKEVGDSICGGGDSQNTSI